MFERKTTKAVPAPVFHQTRSDFQRCSPITPWFAILGVITCVAVNVHPFDNRRHVVVYSQIYARTLELLFNDTAAAMSVGSFYPTRGAVITWENIVFRGCGSGCQERVSSSLVFVA